MMVPEIRRQLGDAAVQQLHIVQRLIVVIILGVNAQNRSLDPQVNVLGNQRDLPVRIILLQGQRHAENVVIRGVAGQRHGRAEPGGPRLKEQPAIARLAIRAGQLGQRQPPVNLFLAAPATKSSRKRLACRTLRATSETPFLA
jgi:hypothetical protein